MTKTLTSKQMNDFEKQLYGALQSFDEKNMTSERKNITQPGDWWLTFHEAAEKAGKTLSEWIGDCCVASLPKRSQAKLSERPPAHRPVNVHHLNR